MNIRVNQDVVEVPGGLATWGDLLDWLETDHLKSGQCITRVSLGRQEALYYRDLGLCGQELQGLSEIDIESGDFDSVVRESLEELDQELNRVAETGSEVVRLFENRDQEAAYALLGQYLESLRVLFRIFTEIGWPEQDGEETTPATLTASLEQALAQLISAQENGFWISVCDVLEYEITPVLDGWKRLVQKANVHIN